MKISKKDISLIKFLSYNKNRSALEDLAKSLTWRKKMLEVGLKYNLSLISMGFIYISEDLKVETKKVSFYVFPFLSNVKLKKIIFENMKELGARAIIHCKDIEILTKNIKKYI